MGTISTDIQTDVIKAIEEMNKTHKERHTVVRSLWVGVLSRLHVLLIGPGGTGKSLICRDLVSRFDGANFFEVALDETTDPSQVFGPPDIKAMVEDGKTRRIPTGMLPEADVAYFDEYFNCLSGDAEVVAPDGSVVRLDEVATLPKTLASVQNGRIAQSEVLDFTGERAPEPTFTLALRSGRSITATADHQFLVHREGTLAWVRLDELRAGDRIATPARIDVFGDLALGGDLVDLLALHVADGSFSARKRPSGGALQYTKLDPALRDLFRTTVAAFGGEAVETDERSFRVRGDQSARDLVKAHCGLVTARDKRVPDVIFTAPRAEVAHFLGVLWSGDGTVQKLDTKQADISYATSSRRLARDVQHLLLRFGITSRLLSFESTNTNTGRIYDAYRVIVSKWDMERFRTEIGPFLVGAKRQRLDAAPDLSPSTSALRNHRYNEDIYLDTIEAIVDGGTQATYCFTTSDANFIANDVVVHNCNTPMLHSLRPILNERLFHNNGQPIKTPLKMAVMGTNKISADTDHAPDWDRVHIREDVKYVADRQNKADLMMDSITRRMLGFTEPTRTTISLSDLDTAYGEAMQLTVPDHVQEVFFDIQDELQGEHGIEISTRRVVEGMAAVLGNAWLNGHEEVKVGDLDILASMWWLTLDQRTDAKGVVLQATNPGEKEALAKLDDLEQQRQEFKNLADFDSVKQNAAGLQIYKNVKRLLNETKPLLDQANAAGTSTTRIKEVVSGCNKLMQTIQKDIFGIDEGDIAS